MAEQVGFIGLGIMGSLQAMNLAQAGYELTVFNRTREKAEAWVAEHGGTVADSPAAVAEASDVVITMVVDGAQVEDMIDQALPGARENTLFIDMSTIAPADVRTIGAELAQRGHALVDAPVTGSSPRAEDGTLTIMAGGAPEDVARAMPAFEAMGETIVHVGALGHGQVIKLINNAVAAANAATLAQALVMGAGTGVDLEALTRILAAGSGNSTMVGLKAEPMRQHDYATSFKTEHMLKDVRLCLEEAQAAGVPFPAANAARDALVGAVGRGYADQDFAAIVEVFEGLAGLRIGDD
jgi:3-hydroxyisobutyrate dehydrogenase-like beta-hydroxyacid dehydrogenase